MGLDARLDSGAARPRRFLVDPSAAKRVAAAFVAADSDPTDPIVRAAYGQLADQARGLFDSLTSPASPLGVSVRFTRDPEPYSCAAELAEAVRTQRVLEIGSVLDVDRHHPLMDCSPGSTHDRFRAVHDLVSHFLLGHDFGRDGEFSGWLAESWIYRGLARWALATELHAHHSVRWTTGVVAPFKAVLLPLPVIGSSAQAGSVAG